MIIDENVHTVGGTLSVDCQALVPDAAVEGMALPALPAPVLRRPHCAMVETRQRRRAVMSVPHPPAPATAHHCPPRPRVAGTYTEPAGTDTAGTGDRGIRSVMTPCMCSACFDSELHDGIDACMAGSRPRDEQQHAYVLLHAAADGGKGHCRLHDLARCGAGQSHGRMDRSRMHGSDVAAA